MPDVVSLIIITLINFIGFILALWIYLSGKRSIVNLMFIMMVIFLMLSLNTMFIAEKFNIGVDIRILLTKLSYVFAAVSTLVSYYFIKYFPVEKFSMRLLDFSVPLLVTIVSCLSMFTNEIVHNVTVSSNSINVVQGNLGVLYYIIYIYFAISILYILIRKYFFSNLSNFDKSKIAILLLGLILFIISSFVFNVIFPMFFKTDKYYYLADYSIIFFFIFSAYAIVKHGLFDVRLAIVRSVTYTLLVGTLAGIYAAVTFGVSSVFNLEQASSPWQTALNIATSLLLVFLFQPLKRFFDRITNKVFYKDNYNTDDFFARMNKTLSVTTDLRSLLERVSYEIAQTLKGEQAFFFIYTTADGNYITAGTEHHNHLPKHDAILLEEESQGKDKVIALSSLKDGDPIKRMMICHRINLILPLIQDGDVVGYLCMGEHLTSGYTNRDIRALNTLSDELIIAIKNALAVHEIRELNATLQQRIANATKELRSKNAILLQLDKIKDEFISMASHQLRTPLTSVKGYLSMVIEGDVGKITPAQKQLLDQAFMSSENMVHLINDFLNVSRIQSGKFIIDKTTVDMSKLVEEEVNGLRPNATARNMKLVYKKPKNFPLVEVDEGKFRQVVMNFSDNAIYYSHENSSIIVSLAVENNEIVFTVKDTGIGVPKSEKDKLFAKFYRAANAKVQRPDGTGVGIYLAKKVVDAHGGQIIFESVEGKGSTFGFRLPIKPIESDTTAK